MAHPLEHELGALLATGLGRGLGSGVQLAVADAHGLIASVAVGHRDHGGAAITSSTAFDLASLTKPVVASAVLRLAARSEVDLSGPLTDTLPGPWPAGARQASLAELLAHEAGFVPWHPLFNAVPIARRGTAEASAAVGRAAAELPPAADPGGPARYSDLGFILLGQALEARYGSLWDLVSREVLGPLSLPLTTAPGEDVAATGRCAWSGRPLTGLVHDDNARAMGRLAGHAGLFGTATTLARFGAAWLTVLDHDGWLPTALARLAVTRRPGGRGLGWDLKSAHASAAGEVASPETFGHLGFTGTSLWIDPRRGLAVALVTNRVLDGDDDLRIREWRPRIHDRIWSLFALE